MAIAILAVSSIPANQMPKSQKLWRLDKLIHATEYAIFAALVLRVFVLRGTRLLVAFVATVVFCSIFGVLDEAYQSTVRGRDSSIFDVLADGTGACFASVASILIYSRKKKTPAIE
ncbi:MAG: hypothetical protein GY811_12690 [Myxococcales bacterium]|nr:hypothetical protein [Myxococcales bacterium]